MSAGGGATAESLGPAEDETEAGKRTEGPLSRVGPPWPPGWLLGVALLLAGAGMAVLASALETDPRPRVLGVNLPVNAGATNALDISAHNSPTLVRTRPRRETSVRWSQTPVPVPQNAEPKCYAPDVAFGANGALYMSFVTLKGGGNVTDAVWIAGRGTEEEHSRSR